MKQGTLKHDPQHRVADARSRDYVGHASERSRVKYQVKRANVPILKKTFARSPMMC